MTTSPDPSPAPRTLRKVMFVEDERDLRTIARVALESVAGFEVLACSSGEEGVRGFLDFDPDVVLLDVMMPGMDGVQTLAALKKLMQKPIPVIFITAKAQKAEVERFKAAGGTDVLLKPFDPMSLGDAIRRIWASFHAARELT